MVGWFAVEDQEARRRIFGGEKVKSGLLGRMVRTDWSDVGMIVSVYKLEDILFHRWEAIRSNLYTNT